MIRVILFSILLFPFTSHAQVMFLECPDGTKKKSVLEKDEIHEWCADKDGVREGGYSLRTADGTPKVFVEYKNDKRNGQYVRYHNNGKPAEQGIIENDKPTGEWKRFHTNGALSDIGKWKDGRPEGEWKFYHDTGKLEAKGIYASGSRTGVWKFYDKEGKFKSDRNYDEKGLLLEGGYLGLYDGDGHSHAAMIGVNWLPFSNRYLKGFSLSLRLGAVKGAGGDEGDSDVMDVYLAALTHYWEFGDLMAGIQVGRVEVGDDSKGNDFFGIDTYVTVNQKWVKRYGFNLSMLDNDIAAITAKAVLWEF